LGKGVENSGRRGKRVEVYIGEQGNSLKIAGTAKPISKKEGTEEHRTWALEYSRAGRREGGIKSLKPAENPQGGGGVTAEESDTASPREGEKDWVMQPRAKKTEERSNKKQTGG